MNKVQQGHAQCRWRQTSKSSVTNSMSSLLQHQGSKNQTQQPGTGKAGMRIQFHQTMLNAMKHWILLDNKLKYILFCNPVIVTNIHDINTQMELNTM